eukprot:gnl/TRDRNA2_/TRDRNA2_173992_c0_seq2.p1 gnl/TRDRNA2_/TRDRNA2_173992_c0~~gnl/TRDRNA2_/TRDRNA2_173992_c0_seq2.p1  ORF type:complete len:420 (-),score=34.09 gnl/TRDRNA2_/TRDRNA2_173992_c0_seq2:111-1370(-)
MPLSSFSEPIFDLLSEFLCARAVLGLLQVSPGFANRNALVATDDSGKNLLRLRYCVGWAKGSRPTTEILVRIHRPSLVILALCICVPELIAAMDTLSTAGQPLTCLRVLSLEPPQCHSLRDDAVRKVSLVVRGLMPNLDRLVLYNIDVIRITSASLGKTVAGLHLLQRVDLHGASLTEPGWREFLNHVQPALRGRRLVIGLGGLEEASRAALWVAWDAAVQHSAGSMDLEYDCITMPSIREMLLEVQTQLDLKFRQHGNHCILTESVFHRATDEQPTRPQLTLDLVGPTFSGLIAAPRWVQTPRPENLCDICGVTSSGMRFRAYPSKAEVLDYGGMHRYYSHCWKAQGLWLVDCYATNVPQPATEADVRFWGSALAYYAVFHRKARQRSKWHWQKFTLHLCNDCAPVFSPIIRFGGFGG